MTEKLSTEERAERRRIKMAQYQATYRQRHKERRKEIDRAYRERKGDALREYQREWKKKQRETNPEFFREYHKAYHAARKGDARIRAKQFVVSIKQRTKAQSLGFDLEDHLEEITERLSKWRCELSGVKLDQGATHTSINSASIDRIDSSKGYLYSNIRIIAWGLNCAFSHWGEEQTAKLMQRWLEIRELA